MPTLETFGSRDGNRERVPLSQMAKDPAELVSSLLWNIHLFRSVHRSLNSPKFSLGFQVPGACCRNVNSGCKMLNGKRQMLDGECWRGVGE